MHLIEPHYNWRDWYIASEDKNSPFYGRNYSEFEFENAVYDHLIHPQWDSFGSNTLYLKILYADYMEGYVVIEMIGEWNDCLYNDVMFLKRNIIETLLENGINKFILIGENVMNFHSGEDDYYREWFDDVEDGWIAAVNFHEHVVSEFCAANIDYYISLGGSLNELAWRPLSPVQLYRKVDSMMQKRLKC
ncbi:MAG: hypothetical protein K9I68_11980 [Bacteroidales bacterium]|nr:hypothetical protein [Bacteroidales bacterium]